jgi:hypothetical protein
MTGGAELSASERRRARVHCSWAVRLGRAGGRKEKAARKESFCFSFSKMGIVIVFVYFIKNSVELLK